MQLVAYGAQDIYLTGNPQITFFKVVYRRHTNFSMETINQNISGQSFIGIDNINNKATVTISRNGDLVTGVFITAKQKDVNNTVGLCGDNIVEDVEIEIGGQRIDKHYKEWNQIWDELTIPSSKADGYKYMTGSFNSDLVIGSQTNQDIIIYPLKFWFCRNPGLALPLIALQYHDVQLKFTWGIGLYDSSKDNNLTRTSQSLTEQHSVEVWADYVYLDTDERRRFSQVSHEYLIEQLQIQKEKDVSSETFKLNLEHPIKELIWTTPQSTPITNQKIKMSINGHDRFYEREKEYFTLEQPYKYHTSIPGYNIKENESPVLLNRSIFSKEYTYQTTNNTTFSGNLEEVDGDNTFLNKRLPDNPTSTSTLTDDDNVFLFVSGGDTPNTDMDFKIGDIVRVNYIKVVDTSRTVQEETNTVSFSYDYDNNGTPATQVSQRKIALKPIDEHNHTDANGAAANNLTDTHVDHLDMTVDYDDTTIENIVRNLTVLKVLKSTTLIENKTLYQITFNDNMGVTAAPNHRVSFEIIARVQNPVSRCSQLKKDIYVYSFCLEPEEHQPSGSCNFSRIDSAKLLFNPAASVSNIYAVNYNVLRIMSGMGGLAYSS